MEDSTTKVAIQLDDGRKPIEALARALGGDWWRRTLDGTAVTYDGPGWLLAGVLAAPVDLEALHQGEVKTGSYRLERSTPLTMEELLLLGAAARSVKMSIHTGTHPKEA